MSNVASGKLRHRVSLQTLVSDRDSEGVLQQSWMEVAEVWAAVEPLSARDFVQAGADQSEVSARITIRYRDNVNAGMRVVHRGKLYDIRGVLADKESGLEYLTLPAAEGVGEGQ